MTTETIIALIAAFGAGFSIGFAVNVVIKFDLNEWLKRRDSIRQTKLRNLCPHVVIFRSENEKTHLRNLVYPASKKQWMCYRCNLIFPLNPFNDFYNSYNENPTQFVREYNARQKSYEKLTKKMGLL